MASYETMKVRPRNPQEPYCYTVASGGADSIVFTGSFVDKLFFITSEGVVATNTFSMQPDGRGLPFSFELDKALSAKPRRVELFFSEDSEGGAIGGCFAINSAATLFFSAGHWDNSIKVRLLSTHKVARAAIEHKDLVTCLGLGTDGKTIVSGSKDTTVIVWDYNFTSLTNSSLLSKTTNLLSTTSEPRTKLDVRRVLTGHDDVVTCVAVSTELDLVAR
jgi:WD40 repeat protein